MDNTVEQFTRLQQLLASGTISEEEFSHAIEGLINRGHAPMSSETPSAELQLQHQLSLIDQEWQKEVGQFKVSYGRYSPRTIPNESGTVMSLFGGLAMIAFGVYWMFEASKASIGGLFPASGLVVIAAGIGLPIYHFTKYSRYRSAYAAYQRRRSGVLAEFGKTQQYAE
jgi:hypothetical protein